MPQQGTAQVWRNGLDGGPGTALSTLVLSLTYPGAQQSQRGSAISTLTIAAGGHGPALTYSAAGLPTGLSIGSGNGQITGTPTVSALYSPIVTVTDGATGVAESVQFDWLVYG